MSRSAVRRRAGTVLAFALAAAAAFPVRGRADEIPAATASVQPSSATLGDILTLDIRVDLPAGFAASALKLEKAIGTFEVAASTAFPVQVQGERAVAHFQALLQNFATGPQLLGAIAVPYEDLHGKAGLVYTSTLSVTIQELAPGPKDKEGQIRGIKGVWGPVAWSPWWWILLAVAGLSLAVYLWHRRQRVLHGPPPEPPVPADEEALQKLAELRESGWIEAGKLKEFYSGVSDTVRAYLERAFKVPALERTTNELMRDLGRRQDLDGDAKTLCRQLFDSCDLVKFAKFRPEAEEALQDHALAVQIVEKTRSVLHPGTEGGRA